MRSIPLGGKLVTSLIEWRSLTSNPLDDDLVFPSKRGAYANHDNMIKRQFAPLFEHLAWLYVEVPARHPPAPKVFNWHALRHFAISCWIEAGLVPKTVQTFAGHSALMVTMDRYGHLFRSDNHAAAMDAIAGEFAGPGRALRPSVKQLSRRKPGEFNL